MSSYLFCVPQMVMLMQPLPSLMNSKFQLEEHMVKAGFPAGTLIPAHMLPFKYLKARL